MGKRFYETKNRETERVRRRKKDSGERNQNSLYRYR